MGTFNHYGPEALEIMNREVFYGTLLSCRTSVKAVTPN